MCYCPTPTLYLNLALTGDCAFQLSPKKPHSVWFISVLKSGDMGQCPEKSPSPCNTCVIPVSLYKSMSWFVTKTRTHARKHACKHHTHTHTHTHTQIQQWWTSCGAFEGIKQNQPMIGYTPSSKPYFLFCHKHYALSFLCIALRVLDFCCYYYNWIKRSA